MTILLGEEPSRYIHSVPSYSISSIAALANVLHDKMSDYRINELAIEEQLANANGRMMDMNV